MNHLYEKKKKIDVLELRSQFARLFFFFFFFLSDTDFEQRNSF